MNPGLRTYSIALIYGLLAGAVTGVTFALMKGFEHVIWHNHEDPLFIFVIVAIGGVLIALLRTHILDIDVNAQMHLEASTQQRRWKAIGLLGASAIIAVGFGGSLGPEAGLLAVVAQLSALVSAKIAHSRQEAALISQAGSAAALAGVYASPPAGATYADEEIAPSKLPVFLSAIAGFIAFIFTIKALGIESHALAIPALTIDHPASLWAIIPAFLGGLLGIGYLVLKHGLNKAITRIPSPRTQTIVGSLALATLLALVPILRFSGHHQFTYINEQISGQFWVTLLLIGCLKALATALSLATGWRGGDIFPLFFAGACVGAATLAVLPALDGHTTMVAGMAATGTVGLRKPIAVFAIVWFLVPGINLIALCLACTAGALIPNLVPERYAYLLDTGHH